MPDALAVAVGVLVVAIVLLGRATGWLRRPPPALDADLAGRVAVVTGANSGIGQVTAGALASLGAHVVMACRSTQRGEAAAAELLAADPNRRLEVRRLDLADLDDVRRFCDEFRRDHGRLDILVNNAGRVVGERGTSPQGHELTLATNHLGPFLLTGHLLGLLEASAPARIVVVGSSSHTGGDLDLDDLQWEARPYRGLTAYATSKLANLLFVRELARRLDPTRVTVACVHPGTIRSGFGAGDGPRWLRLLLPLARWAFLTPERGADGSVFLAAGADPERFHGAYVVRRRVVPGSRASRDLEAARALWLATEELVGPAAATSRPTY